MFHDCQTKKPEENYRISTDHDIDTLGNGNHAAFTATYVACAWSLGQARARKNAYKELYDQIEGQTGKWHIETRNTRH